MLPSWAAAETEQGQLKPEKRGRAADPGIALSTWQNRSRVLPTCFLMISILNHTLCTGRVSWQGMQECPWTALFSGLLT